MRKKLEVFMVKAISIIEDIAAMLAVACLFGAITFWCLDLEARKYLWAGLFANIGIVVLCSTVVLRWPQMVMRTAMSMAKKGQQ